LGLAARAGELDGLAASTTARRRHDTNKEAKRDTAQGELAGMKWEDAMELTCTVATSSSGEARASSTVLIQAVMDGWASDFGEGEVT
jgi:hypothetical protein